MAKKKRRKTPRRLPIKDREIIRHRWTNGEEGKALALEYGVHPKTVYDWVKKEGWTRPGRPKKIPTQDATVQPCVQTDTPQNAQGELLRPQAPAAQPPALVQATGRQLRVAEGVWHIIETFLETLRGQGMPDAPEAAARAIHSLTQSLERLQKVERTALDADTHKDARVSVVIVVPAKQELDAWQSMAVEAVVEEVEE